MSCKLALVDFDGTLVDSMPYWLELPFVTLKKYGIPEPEGFADRIRGDPMWKVSQQLEAEYPVLRGDRTLRERWDDDMLENYRLRVRKKPGAEALLALLREEGAKVCVLSATRERILSQALAFHGFMPLLDAVFDEANFGSKQKEDTYRALAERCGCRVDEVLLVDDAPFNIKTAAAAGCATVAVREGCFAHQVPELQAAAGLYVPALTETDAIRAYIRNV